MICPQLEKETVKYKLSGVIEHFGSYAGGHYIAYRKLFSQIDKK